LFDHLDAFLSPPTLAGEGREGLSRASPDSWRQPAPGALRTSTSAASGSGRKSRVNLANQLRARCSDAFSAARSTSAPARYIFAIRRVLRILSSGLPSSTRKSARLPD